MGVFLLATCDTKGREADFLRALLTAEGIPCRLVDTGGRAGTQLDVDLSRAEVFAAAGSSLGEVEARAERGFAVDTAARGAAQLLRAAFERGELEGVLSLGGSAGTTIGTAAMRTLPLGVPKLMVSTLASGAVRQYVGDKDILMLNPVVDIAGLNRISRPVLANAAAAMAGMVRARRAGAAQVGPDPRPLVAATMFGVTTPCVERARQELEAAGCEVLVFHATGSGGEALESLVREGLVAGVLDMTTTELADELVGGVLSAGPTRLTAAGECGVPQVISVGATDMVNFLARASVPPEFAARRLHVHNANVTLMRTEASECRAIGRDLGAKAARARGPTRILLPARGVSALDVEGGAFDDPEARAALFAGVKETSGDVPCVVLDLHINDEAFAVRAARELLDCMETQPT